MDISTMSENVSKKGLAILRQIRPRSWLKNGFIFAPLFFAGLVFDAKKFLLTTEVFILFCLVASAVYVINDLIDLDQDKKHITKKNRPLASGTLTILQGRILVGLLLLATLVCGLIVSKPILLYVGAYFILNILYSYILKKIPIIDILCISLFFLIRIMAGGIAADIRISLWLIVCTIFVSLFLITGKRLAEFDHKERRSVLKSYSEDFLKILLVISATLCIISYSFYALFILDSYLAIMSILFVMFGVFRYILLVYTSGKAEYPEKVVIEDKPILISCILWGITMFFIFYSSIG